MAAPSHPYQLRWSERAHQDFRHRLRKLTSRSWGVSMDYRLQTLTEYVRGWMGYFGISDYYRPIPELDHWLRRQGLTSIRDQWMKAHGYASA
ncbi:group II intron maturase-specific domain-containing protein [Ectothiorhodospira sp. BSL-9]|uniref:group II intron maturase-specific domain-containing protein n=1 Tax=Ectothiorhodospira sp. BSL-9 TaxID=1442136 RepID=UPI001F0A1153|nr:group II intron maturase-specific domain-containing protein [Ectothiorhodospira sp. BSL-9]